MKECASSWLPSRPPSVIRWCKHKPVAKCNLVPPARQLEHQWLQLAFLSSCQPMRFSEMRTPPPIAARTIRPATNSERHKKSVGPASPTLHSHKLAIYPPCEPGAKTLMYLAKRNGSL